VLKLTENIFRSVNIALVNELKCIYARMGMDIREVIDAAKTKPFGYMPFYPGPGLGGHCIPIDPFYLTWKAREFGVTTRFIELSGEINAAMPGYVIEVLADALNRRFSKSLKGARVLLLGVAYKKNVNDVRESPAFALIEGLEERGARVDYFDPFVARIPKTREHGARDGGTAIRVACAARTSRWGRTHRAHGARYGWTGDRLWERTFGRGTVDPGHRKRRDWRWLRRVS